MNEHTSFERHVIEAFDREGPGRPVPDAIHDDLLARAGRKRQWPSWLASIKEPPMRISDSLAVGSPTVRVAAILAATLLLAVALATAGIAGQRLFAAGADIVVDQDGGGDYTTIAEAVDAAEDGQSILVRDGTYDGSVTITRAVSLRGESGDGVIVEFGAGCTVEGENEEMEQTCAPEVKQMDGTQFMPPGPFGLHLDDTEASVSDLTLRHLSRGYGLYVTGGAPTVSNVTYANNSYENPDGLSFVMLRGGTAATVTASDFGQGWVDVSEHSPVIIEKSTAGSFLAETPLDEASGGPAIFRENTTDGMIWIAGMAVVEGNEIHVPEDLPDSRAIYIERGEGWTVRDNIITGTNSTLGAIEVDSQAGRGQIVGNTLEGNEVGILLWNGSLVEANTLTDGTTGILVKGGSPDLVDNTMEGMSTLGIGVEGLSGPTLSENRACGSTTDLSIGFASTAVVDDTNEFCVVDDQREE